MSEPLRQPGIAFIGLGAMGMPMAIRLLRAGHAVTGYDLLPSARVAFLAEGGLAADDMAQAMAGKDVVITMLPNGDIVRQALLDTGGAAAMRPAGIVVDMSSSAPAGTVSLGKALAEMGLTLVDAPVSGGVKKAREGGLAVMIGGPAEAIERIRPILSCFGSALFLAGPTGAGHAVKSLNNYVSAAGLAAMCEALAVGKRFGIAPAALIDILNASSGRNNSTENKAKQFVLSGTYDAGFAMKLMAKDIGIAADLASGLGIELPGLTLMREMWASASQNLGPAADHTEIDRYIADLAERR
jgi:3-hydroxyisobutyrate dehydrogenase